MTDTAEIPTAPKRSMIPLLGGFVMALVLGGGGFYVTWSGLIGVGGETVTSIAPIADIAFVPLDPLIISLSPAAQSKHLRFSAQLEVSSRHRADVARLAPRILDVLNGYLRAVAVQDLEDPSALAMLRAQMLRRIQIVTGEGRVRDLLVTEFVLN